MEIRQIANLGRFKDIVMILIKYGFDDLAQRLDLSATPLIKKIHKTGQELSTYERIRLALEDLGPTFVKFGQVMSLRPDLLPQALIKELVKLQDDVAPVSTETIHETVGKDLHGPLKEVFSVFDDTPLGAASLAQVHRGVLKKEGTIVSVKVQRPGIRKKVEKDLDILETVAEQLHEHSQELRFYDLPNLVRVTRRNLLREMDFTREARHMRIARSFLPNESNVMIPAVYTQYSTQRLLVTEFVQGTKLKDLDPEELDDPEGLAKQGLNAAIKQILEDGFFHADPHPGNLLVTAKGALCLLDWGNIGRLTERDRYELIDLIKAVVEKDSKGLMDALLVLSSGQSTINRRSLERQLLEILDAYHAVPVKDLNIGHLLMDITILLREYRLALPPDLVIMTKAMITAEGTARGIYPDLNIVSEAQDYVKRLALQRYKSGAVWRSIRAAVTEFFTLQRQLPRQITQIADKIDQGKLKIHFEHENLGGLRNTLENTSNRLTFGIIIAAMIIGSSMIITTGVGPLLFGFPALGILGYTISGLLGLWLIWNIIRTKRY
jgi:ubiquinone biosynthesis protein